MSDHLKTDSEYESKPTLDSIFSKWGEVFSKTFESYCARERDPHRRHSITILVFVILGIVGMSIVKVPSGVLYAFIGLGALVLVLSSKRME